MKSIIFGFLLSIAVLIGVYRERPFDAQAAASSGAIFVINPSGQNKFHCSGTEIGKTKDGGGIFLTARHCVADPDTNVVDENMVVSFSSNEGGPFYTADPIAISLDDDLAILYLSNGSNIPVVKIKDERSLRNGDAIFNTSFPRDSGKVVFHGEYLSSRFSHFPESLAEYRRWANAMPINLTIAHGSSGSGIFSKNQHALIGVAVGTFEEGSYNIAIPADRIIDFLKDLPDNTVEKFEYAFPVKDAPEDY